jgi:hypothetical protein
VVVFVNGLGFLHTQSDTTPECVEEVFSEVRQAPVQHIYERTWLRSAYLAIIATSP